MKNIYQKISDIMKDVEYLQKDDNVDNRYKVISEEKVTGSIRASMIKNGVVIIPIEQVKITTEHGVTKSGSINLLTETDTKYRIQNIEDKEDYIIAVSSGSGVDTQDKGIGKAMTYSYKYLLLRTFAIPTGEDPDKISSDEIDEQITVKKIVKTTTPKIEEVELKNLVARWTALCKKYGTEFTKEVWNKNNLGQSFSEEGLDKAELVCQRIKEEENLQQDVKLNQKSFNPDNNQDVF